ncbi:MAG: hypothetical protein IPJ07_02390 [Acidobacteria bacterium]|nr:hypothetical protein [Acidobacteriota bacterium]
MPTFKSRRPAKKRPGPPNNNKMNSNKKGGGGRNPRMADNRPKKKFVSSAGSQSSLENTGMEALYMRKLVESEKTVVVVMTTGESFRGSVRYFDRDVFSLGPSDGSPKIFLRKSSIRYLYEEE